MNLPEYFQNNPKIIINDIDLGYFIKLAKILKKKNIKTIAFYVHLLLIRKSDIEYETITKVNIILKYKIKNLR